MRAVLGGVLEAVQGTGYARWFVIMALLHPLAWLLLRMGGILRAAQTSR